MAKNQMLKSKKKAKLQKSNWIKIEMKKSNAKSRNELKLKYHKMKTYTYKVRVKIYAEYEIAKTLNCETCSLLEF